MRRHPRRTPQLLLFAATAAFALLALAPDAFASAGGGSAGFSDGGGGGGGGFGGGGGHGFALFIIFRLLFDIALLGHGLGLLFLIALGFGYYFFTSLWPRMQAAAEARRRQGGARRRETKRRQRKVELAAAEAAEEDDAFGPAQVRADASELFLDIQSAWDQADRIRLRGLIAPRLMDEWERRLDDLESRGWRNHVEPVGEPTVEYVGIARGASPLAGSGGQASDRVVVRIEAKLRDYVVDRSGRHIRRTGQMTESTRMREYWTLERRDDHWVLASIESGSEGEHALRDQIVQTDFSDTTGLRDEAIVEGAVADAVPDGTKVSEIAPLQFDGDAHAAALDISLADGRFAPDVLEVAARRAVNAWMEAIDGEDTNLEAIADRSVVRDMLHPAADGGQTRLVVRGVEIKRIRVTGLEAHAEPPTMTIDVDMRGRRYLEDRDTTAVVAGSATRTTGFTERWTLALTDNDAQPWRIVSVKTPVVA
jgi:predicted lipid-binding transport protein (Tim44 family)